MSRSMWAWRVIVPGFGLLACLTVYLDPSHLDPASIRKLLGSPAASTPTGPKLDAEDRIVAEGRVAPRPGAEVTVGTESGGMVTVMAAVEKARVRKGDLLVEFSSDDLKAALADAEGRLAEFEAEFAFQNAEFQKRSKAKTDPKQFVADLEGTRRDLAVAEARRRSANALVARARLALARARVVSPIDGVILARYVEGGEIAPPGARLVTICDLARVRVEAEIDEFDAGKVAPGDPAEISAEGHEGPPWKGTVDEVPDRVAPRFLRPEDPGRPSDTRVLLVKIALDDPLPLKLGQQVGVVIRRRKTNLGGPARPPSPEGNLPVGPRPNVPLR